MRRGVSTLYGSSRRAKCAPGDGCFHPVFIYHPTRRVSLEFLPEPFFVPLKLLGEGWQRGRGGLAVRETVVRDDDLSRGGKGQSQSQG